MPKRLLTVAASLLCLSLTSLSLTGCEKDALNREGSGPSTPESWQLHLKPTTLAKDAVLAMQESIYVPIYSHIYVENEQRTADLAATLSFRNIDPSSPIILKSVRYYSTDGKLLKDYLTSPVSLEPLATADFVVARDDSTGGAGANFIVDWVSKQTVVEPLAEAVMVGTGSPQSMSFTSRGVVIKRAEINADKSK